MNTQIRLLVFDWDGTLVNSLARIVASVHHATGLCGLKRCTDPEVHSIIGLSLKNAFLRLYPEPGQARLYDTFRQAYSAHYLEQEQDPSPSTPVCAMRWKISVAQVTCWLSPPEKAVRDWTVYSRVTACRTSLTSPAVPMKPTANLIL